ncbi:MAG: hypothetical protein IT318_21970 [Anaerolineales bacterium]|nr:hypothetical protein [Anaerolineales bacterium]
MEVHLLREPELQFGNGRHIDIRFGLMNYGPLDIASSLAPNPVKLGIVGTPETIQGILHWLEECKKGISAKLSKRPNLFPRFPGYGPESLLPTAFEVNPSLQRTLPAAKLDALTKQAKTGTVIREVTEMYLSEMEYLAQKASPNVLICALPANLVALIDQVGRADEGELDTQGSEAEAADAPVFHDLLKAQAMRLRIPTQVVRPSTYGGLMPPRPKGTYKESRQLQDDATRAWNFYVALYYKAGGAPWRLLRNPSDFTVCYVGVSFYQALDKSKLLTSTAQVFSERGEGIIVRGGPARIDKDDLQIHLEEEDAHRLLMEALRNYKSEHGTLPARLVMHKSSTFNQSELAGFRGALSVHGIERADFLSLTRSSTRLFRAGAYPPLRGTLLVTNSTAHILYTKGSVDFFTAYPGMYVPRPLKFRCDATTETPHLLAQEILALTKMNWNNTQFDGGDPITLRAARQVGAILKHIGESDPFEPYYRYYM